MTDTRPHFKHDQPQQTYLGSHYFPHKGKTVWDLYYAPFNFATGPEGVVARSGDHPNQYEAADLITLRALQEVRGEQYPLCEAYRRARERGLLQ